MSSYRKGRNTCKSCTAVQKAAWSKRNLRWCPQCDRRRARRLFDSPDPDARCGYCRGAVKQKSSLTEHHCIECQRLTPKAEFGESRWYAKQYICLECRPLQHDVPVDDIQYDYAFAREILGFGPEKALEWVSGGYRNQAQDTIVRSVDPAKSWEPDPLVAA
ncbi:hypothetical protein [Nocardia grenadensis]|uniref:hypothetical protein n=1 Tax=Nocardia grenadensis TaxID=931537 RepID=UPI000AA840AB|nr:hypothetical protein [Nocardia grenadensis]